MIDFFHKSASMTKRIDGIAKMKGEPVVHARDKRTWTRIGTFTDGGKTCARVLLEVADTPAARKEGMMGRSELPRVCGMLFEGLSGGGYFWMKDCLIPLDVAFMDASGMITRTYSMPVDPEGIRHYAYDDADVLAVELADGFLRAHGIKPGVRVVISDIHAEDANE